MTLPVYTPTKRTLLLDVDADTYIISDTDDEIQFFAGGAEIAEFDAAEITFNSASAATDFKVLTDGSVAAISVDAGVNAGKGSVTLGYTANPDGNNRAWLKVYPPALTTAAGKSTSLVSIQPDYVLTMNGTVPVAATLQLEEPNLSGSPTTAATLYIKDAPTEGGTNNAAIYILAGDISMNGTSYLKLPIHDTDGTVEGSLWYDASEDKLKFKTAAGVETITSS
jgi:hypothetical protein